MGRGLGAVSDIPGIPGFRRPSRSRPGDEEDVGGLVGYPDFLPGLGRGGGLGGGGPAGGVQTLDARDPAEPALPRTRSGGQQQPGDGTRRLGGVLGFHFADDHAAVEALPGGAGIMAADLRAGGVEQVGFRRLETPLKPGGVVLAGPAFVDLDAGGGELEGPHLVGGGLQGRGHYPRPEGLGGPWGQ